MKQEYGHFDNRKLDIFFNALFSEEKFMLLNLSSFAIAAVNQIMSNNIMKGFNDMEKQISYPNYLREVKKQLKLADEELSKSSFKDIKERQKNLDYVKRSTDKLIIDDESIISDKLHWTGLKGTLLQLMRALKQKHTLDDKPLIADSYEVIAKFLKVNFDIYKDTSVKSIQDKLERDPEVLKTGHNIEIKLN